MSNSTNQHLSLDAKNFYGYAALIGLTGAIQIFWGLVDLWTASHQGLAYVAGLGLSDFLNSVVGAIVFGAVDIYASQIARSESEKSFNQTYFSDFSALCVALFFCLIPVVIWSEFGSVSLRLLHEPPLASTIATSNFHIRAWFFPISVLYVALPITLRIIGRKNLALMFIATSFIIKIILNLLIYLGYVDDVPIERALAYSSVIAQCVAILASLAWIFNSSLIKREVRVRIEHSRFKASLRDIASHAPGLGLWNLNDYCSSFVVLLLLGQYGVAVLAAANIASKITSLFYRIPQACCESAFVYYGYVINEDIQIRINNIIRIIRYGAIPTIVSAVFLGCFSTQVATWVSGKTGIANAQAGFIIWVHMLFVPAYVMQHLFAQFLAIERRTKFLSFTSALSTYGFVIPSALICVFVFKSWHGMVILERCSILVLAIFNVWALSRAHITKPDIYFLPSISRAY